MPRRHSGSAAVPTHRLHIGALRRLLREPLETPAGGPPEPASVEPTALRTARQPGVRWEAEPLHLHGPVVPGGCSSERTQQRRQ